MTSMFVRTVLLSGVFCFGALNLGACVDSEGVVEADFADINDGWILVLMEGDLQESINGSVVPGAFRYMTKVIEQEGSIVSFRVRRQGETEEFFRLGVPNGVLRPQSVLVWSEADLRTPAVDADAESVSARELRVEATEGERSHTVLLRYTASFDVLQGKRTIEGWATIGALHAPVQASPSENRTPAAPDTAFCWFYC